MRAKCLVDTKEGIKDPEITAGRFYNVLETDVMVMGESDIRISIVGDKGIQIDRPGSWFKELK